MEDSRPQIVSTFDKFVVCMLVNAEDFVGVLTEHDLPQPALVLQFFFGFRLDMD